MPAHDEMFAALGIPAEEFFYAGDKLVVGRFERSEYRTLQIDGWDAKGRTNGALPLDADLIAE